MTERRTPSSRPHATGERLSVAEVIARHHGKWVLLHITAEDRGWPSEGVVLAVSSSRKRISNFVQQRFKDGTLPSPNCIFQAIRHIKTVGEWREMLSRPGLEHVDA